MIPVLSFIKATKRLQRFITQKKTPKTTLSMETLFLTIKCSNVTKKYAFSLVTCVGQRENLSHHEESKFRPSDSALRLSFIPLLLIPFIHSIHTKVLDLISW